MAREALTCLREALRLDPEDKAGAGIELGRSLQELGEWDRAVAAYRDAVTHHPERSDLWSDLAILYSEMGLFTESDQAVREAIRLKPNNAAAWHTIATNTLKQGKRETAQRAYRRMKELNPDFADEILSWVANTTGLPPDTLSEPVLAEDPLARGRRGRLLPFRGRA
jgi:tetratricopeptide (TPR) repeat protein